ncbi:TRAP transporter substrate-binding protein DctP [Chachezhania sediminis]|uniref:TRAP transporter substrate-binding protein DctP n=1 Tax=Chachezhania sediminis TaxID=2599291 RepID=UPI00131C05E4|nr:TRAP transporter substrate-binding protein DctP [Chachezhania sediminis]
MTRSKTALFALAALATTALAPVEALAERTLRAASFLPLQSVFAEPMVMFSDHVNEIGKGVLQINLVGPDAIPAVEQANALRSGLLDMGAIPPGLYKQMVPLGNAQDISDMTVAEQKASGGYQMMADMVKEQMGTVMLATYGDGIPFHLYTANTITSMDDLKGKRVRSSPIFHEFFSSLGLTNADISVPEAYTALERGVVFGYGWPAWGIEDLGWDKFTKQRIDPGFYNVTINILMNGKTYDSLTPEEKKVIDDTIAWFDVAAPEFQAAKGDYYREQQDKAGVQSFDGGADLSKRAADIYWEELAKIDADKTAKLRAVFQK